MRLIKFFILLVILVCTVGCTVPEKDALRLMQQEGIKDPKFDGYAILGCGDKDDTNIKFSGQKNGVKVKGVICGSLFGLAKNYTIRYE